MHLSPFFFQIFFLVVDSMGENAFAWPGSMILVVGCHSFIVGEMMLSISWWGGRDAESEASN